MIFSLFLVRDEGLTACSHFQYCRFIGFSIILSFLPHSHLSLVLCSACLALTRWLVLCHAALSLSCNPSVPPSSHRGTNVQSISTDGSCKTPRAWVWGIWCSAPVFWDFLWRLSPWAEVIQAGWKSILSQDAGNPHGSWVLIIAGSERVKGNAMPALAASLLPVCERGATPCQPFSHAGSTSQGKALLAAQILGAAPCSLLFHTCGSKGRKCWKCSCELWNFSLLEGTAAVDACCPLLSPDICGAGSTSPALAVLMLPMGHLRSRKFPAALQDSPNLEMVQGVLNLDMITGIWPEISSSTLEIVCCLCLNVFVCLCLKALNNVTELLTHPTLQSRQTVRGAERV